MRRLPVWPEPGSDEGARHRAAALDDARSDPAVAALLGAAIEAMRAATDAEDHRVDLALSRLDTYLATLSERASAPLSCAPGCAACCSDAPPVFPVEAARLRERLGPAQRERAGRAAEVLRQMAETEDENPSTEAYRERQLAYRAQGHRCPALGEDDRCSVYAARPLACRVYAAIEDPAHCNPAHPRFREAEHPARWATPSQYAFEAALLDLGERCGLGREVRPLPVALAGSSA